MFMRIGPVKLTNKDFSGSDVSNPENFHLYCIIEWPRVAYCLLLLLLLSMRQCFMISS